MEFGQDLSFISIKSVNWDPHIKSFGKVPETKVGHLPLPETPLAKMK